MGGRYATRSEVTGGFDDSPSEMPLPDSVHENAGRKRVRRSRNPVRQLQSLVDILEKLSVVRVSHGDLKATNFVMSEQGAVLIDLDAMKEHRSQQGFKQAFNRDLQRFLKNWSEYPLLNARFSELLRDLCARYHVKP